MKVAIARIIVVGLVSAPLVVGSAQSPARWTIESKPVVTIGASEADTTDLLAVVVGAARLPDGRILVGDRGGFETLPAHAAIRVDSRGHLWVQDYPRADSRSIPWAVFDPHGREIASVELPVHLDVYEIGDDYVLGRFMDPDELIPQVRMFRLHRGERNR